MKILIIKKVNHIAYGDSTRPILGPLLIGLYVSPAANIISKYAVDHLQYAVDMQLFPNGR